MQITSITQNKKHENLVSIFLDEVFWLGLDKNDLLKFNLYKSREINKEEKDEIEKVSQLGKVKSQILKLVSLRPRSRKEVYDNLIYKKEIASDIANNALDSMETFGYINDLNFAKWYIEMRLNSGKYGRNKIKFQLIEKGVEGKLIEIAFHQLQEEKPNLFDNSEDIQKLIKKFSSTTKGKSPQEIRNKIIAKLMARGFKFDEIKRLI